MRIDRWQTGVAMAVVGLALAGCAGGSASPRTAAVTTVTDVTNVAGIWTGLLEVEGGGDRDDFIELTVDKSGAYRASAARTVGLLDAKGTIAVTDGKVRLQGDRGARATGTLYAPSGRRHPVGAAFQRAAEAGGWLMNSTIRSRCAATSLAAAVLSSARSHADWITRRVGISASRVCTASGV